MTSSVFYNIGIIFFKKFALQIVSYVPVVFDMVLWMVCIKIYSVKSSRTWDCDSINLQFIFGYDVTDWETFY